MRLGFTIWWSWMMASNNVKGQWKRHQTKMLSKYLEEVVCRANDSPEPGLHEPINAFTAPQDK